MDTPGHQQESPDAGSGSPPPHRPGLAPLVQGGGPRGVPRHLCGWRSEGGHLPDQPPAANPVSGERQRLPPWIIQILFQKHGLVTSGPLFIYWFMAAICFIPTFRLKIRLVKLKISFPWTQDCTLSHLRSVIGGNLIHYNTYEIPFVTLTLQLPIVGAILFLNCFSDAKPKYIDLEEQVEKLTPERFASFPSKMFFTWFDGLIWKGWKKTLAIEDLWALAFYNRFNSISMKKDVL